MKRLLDMPASSPLLEQAQRLIEAAPAVDDSTQQMLRIRRALDRPELSGARGALLRAPSLVLGGALVVFGASAFAAVRVWVEHRAPHEAAEPRAGADLAPHMQTEQTPEVPAAALEASQPSAAVPSSDSARLAPRASEPLVFATESTPQLSPRARVKSTQKASRIRRTKLSRPTRRTAARVASVAPALTRATEAAAVPESVPVPARASPEAHEVDDATRTEVDSIAAAPVAARMQPEPERVSQLRAADSDEAREPREEREQVAEPGVSAPAKRSSDSELVVHAVRALRRDGDPEAALRLLERYRSRNPSGVLAEEVLSLQIEAAHGADGAHGANEARAAAFAREYLSRYPEGRYRVRARRALAGEAP